MIKTVPAFPLYINPKRIRRCWADGETGSLIGIIERVLFTILFAGNVNGTAVAMVTWIMLKNSTLWADFSKPKENSLKQKEPKRLFVSMMSSVGSMLIAFLGAQICKGVIHF
jgi:hypothetical protein